MRKKVKIFRGLCDEAIKKADELFKGPKNSDYNSGGIEITDYFDYEGIDNMPKKAFHDVRKKYLRLHSLILSGKKPKNESLEQNCIDMINYIRFLYAAIKMAKKWR